MIDWQAIEGALRERWLLPAAREVPGAEASEVTFASERGPRPSLPYCSLRLITAAGVARDERRPVQADGTRSVVGTRILSASVQAYGPGARRIAEHARSKLFTGAVAASLRTAGVIVYDASAVRDLTGLDQVSFEERGQFDARFAVASSILETAGVVERAEGGGALEGTASAAGVSMDWAAGPSSREG